MSSIDRDINAEIVTAVVQHEFFKFQVQQQAEAQTRQFLSVRTRIVSSVGAVVLAVLGWFGVQQHGLFTAAVDSIDRSIADIEAKSRDLDGKIQHADQLLATARQTVGTAGGLLEVAKENVSTSRQITGDAGETARQTSDLARAVLDQVQATQNAVDARSAELKKNLDAASQKIGSLSEEQAKLESVTRDIAEIRRTSSEVSARRAEIEAAAQTVAKTTAALTQSLNFERELARAKTFEILLLRDGRSVEITLPDFRDAGPTQRKYTLLVEALNIKDKVDFRITVNGRKPAHSFDGFVQGDSERIPDSPFSVRVDSVYHAKLAYDFVMLRINPAEAAPPVPAAAIASAAQN